MLFETRPDSKGIPLAIRWESVVLRLPLVGWALRGSHGGSARKLMFETLFGGGTLRIQCEPAMLMLCDEELGRVHANLF